MMAAPAFSALRTEYTTLWTGMIVDPARIAVIDAIAAALISGKGRYQAVERATGVPWFVIALIHQLEAGGSWTGHLHNGDPLSARTRQVPAGRPKSGAPPFSWTESAVDALRYEGLDRVRGWSLPRIAYELEAYNGFGSRSRGIHSPYLWSYSNWYRRGKYIADHVWSDNAVSAQCGAMPLLARMVKRDASIADYIEGKTSPLPLPPDIASPRPQYAKPALSWLGHLIASIFRRTP